MEPNRMYELYRQAKPGFFFSSRVLALLQVLVSLPLILVIILTGHFSDPIANKVCAYLSVIGLAYYFFGLVLPYFLEKKAKIITRIMQTVAN